MTSVTEVVTKLLTKSSLTRNCDSCSVPTLHTSQSTIWNQPAITVICINRFIQANNGNITKNDSVVHCDSLLSAPGIDGRLIGVVLHKGTLSHQAITHLWSILITAGTVVMTVM